MARKLKKFVIPTLISSIALVGGTYASLTLSNNNKSGNYDYKLLDRKIFKEDDSSYVFDETSYNPIKPFLEETVGVYKDYYSVKDNEEEQRHSLIYYENTYIPNTGILYSDDDAFEIISTMDGKVLKVGNDNLLGNYVELMHSDGYKTAYYSLKETNVTEGSEIKRGDVIGTSGENKLVTEKSNNLLFEVYKDGINIDPEDFFKINFTMN